MVERAEMSELETMWGAADLKGETTLPISADEDSQDERPRERSPRGAALGRGRDPSAAPALGRKSAARPRNQAKDDAAVARLLKKA